MFIVNIEIRDGHVFQRLEFTKMIITYASVMETDKLEESTGEHKK